MCGSLNESPMVPSACKRTVQRHHLVPVMWNPTNVHAVRSHIRFITKVATVPAGQAG